ncbi:hypothetical protein KQ940_10245 [Marinobacterium sp. D7]|uniref:hypothetical protein n=1 Tax=Marinobacterium ramblicola TaxID=2849041 RepID=UPI001C2CDFE9|nr:hypothetical protein [Marinobacterium ramblicola]MBV1788437.1 hypothetical protein [Marinobacterium ramblicola]
MNIAICAVVVQDFITEQEYRGSEMSTPIELTQEERRCLLQVSVGSQVEQSCRRGVLERLQEMGLVEVAIQVLPMFPLERRYRITPLGKQVAGSMP